jgi:PAS domain S-box-containing protein
VSLVDGDDWLYARLAELEDQLREANETLDAIRNGDVDAVVVGTAAKQVIYTLENADRPYRTLVEQMQEGALTLSCEGLILYCNQSFASLVGRPIGHLIGNRFHDYIRERARVDFLLTDDGAGKTAELSLLTHVADNPVNVSFARMAGDIGGDQLFCCIVTDLSQNYRRAREIAAANQRLAAEIAERTKAEESLAIALEAADMGRWEIVLSTDTVNRSPRHDAIFGYDVMLPAWSLKTTLDHFLREDRPLVSLAFENAASTGHVEFERRICRASDGATRWVSVKGRRVQNTDENDRFAGIIVDVTESRFVEEQLRQAQKMEAVGQLTGGIAHDFNNLLMIIGGSLEALARRAELEPRCQKFLMAAQQGVARGAKLNAQLLAFARRQDMKVISVCINDLLPDFETLLDRAVGERVTVKVIRADKLWFCATDPHQLETAILNLAINARDAMGPGGRLTLSTANEPVSATKADEFGGSPGDYVVTSLTDTGCGMTPEVIARAFEPFFTTKDIGKGTGLGLSQVYGFAKQSGGFVSIDSVFGRGTTISIYLPRTNAPDAAEQLRTTRALTSHHGVVLLVEDDPDVRSASSAMLEELGYVVRSASSADEALQALRANSNVDVVFTDVVLSTGMSGIDLAHAVNAKWPILPVLLTSGYTAQRVIPAALNGEFTLLRKPYTMHELAHAMQKITRSVRMEDVN